MIAKVWWTNLLVRIVKKRKVSNSNQRNKSKVRIIINRRNKNKVRIISKIRIIIQIAISKLANWVRIKIIKAKLIKIAINK